MSEARPLLALDAPTVGKIPQGNRNWRPLQKPSSHRQGERLAPQFDALRNAFEQDRALLVESTNAPDPRLVTVFDLAGTVEGFMRATRGIEGLEFLAELQDEYVLGDEDFYYEEGGEPSDDRVPKSLYMVMSSDRAVGDLVSLFERWQDDNSVRFHTGLNPLKQVFENLRAVRRWGPEDRVRETNLLEQWQEDVEVAGAQGLARIEIELWFRGDESERAAAEESVSGLVAAEGGRTVWRVVVEEIGYHALLADIPFDAVERVLAEGAGAIDVLCAEAVMFVSPAVPMQFPTLELADEAEAPVDDQLPSGEPRVALLDGVPLTSHAALDGRLVVDDPDDRASLYAASQQVHGTAMASLILHGDLSNPGPALDRPIYVRPVLQPHSALPREITPPDQLLVDVVHRAFVRMFEPEGAREPAAPGVRIVNLSIGDPARVFARRMSPLAKLLDWLAHRYNLLVVVSAGNHPDSAPTVPSSALDDPEELGKAGALSLHSQARQRRLLAPAESVNALTVGAQHKDEASSQDLPDAILDAIPEGMPAPYSPVGFGFRRSVKPEVTFPGGRQVYQRPAPNAEGDVTLAVAPSVARGPGLLVAAPGQPGELTGMAFTCGTSDATALATRAADRIVEVLEGMQPEDDDFPVPDAQYHPVLAKTLLVHSAGWEEVRHIAREALQPANFGARRDLTQLLGYGPARPQRVVASDRVRPVLIGASSIRKDERHTHRVPLPPALAATTEWRRLTLTLGWLSPVNPRSQKHRMARLSLSAPGDALGVEAREADYHAIRKGTVQHEVREGTAAVAFSEGDALSVNVDCRVDAGRLTEPVRYALAVSLELGVTARADLHAEVRQRLRVASRERVRARATG